MLFLLSGSKTLFLSGSTPHSKKYNSGIIAFGAALDYLTEIGFDRIYQREEERTVCAENLLSQIPEVQILGRPKLRAGVLSFIVDGVHPYDLASFIDKFGVALRTGSMCAQPIVNKAALLSPSNSSGSGRKYWNTCSGSFTSPSGPSPCSTWNNSVSL